MKPATRLAAVLALAGLLAMAFAGCGAATQGAATQGATAAGSEGGPAAAVSVAAAFYPLQFLVEQVGGDRVTISGLTAPGGEPHDLELTPRALVTLSAADLVVYEAGFQPALDDALQDRHDGLLDVSSLADRAFADGERDPHFWNDPTRYAEAAAMVGDALAAADPAGATAYRANAAALDADLAELDGEAVAALASCRVTTLVTAHDAFGYFAERYGFTAVSIAGISPDAEPPAADLAAIADTVRSQGVTTIYTETLVPLDVARTVAAETGAATAVLDPIEGVTDASPGIDYPSIMRANVAAVAAGQGCD